MAKEATKVQASRPLSAAQEDHLLLLIEKLNEAQAKANKFLTAYAQDHGIQIGVDGWTFDQATMRFVQMPGKENA